MAAWWTDYICNVRCIPLLSFTHKDMICSVSTFTTLMNPQFTFSFHWEISSSRRYTSSVKNPWFVSKTSLCDSLPLLEIFPKVINLRRNSHWLIVDAIIRQSLKQTLVLRPFCKKTKQCNFDNLPLPHTTKT